MSADLVILLVAVAAAVWGAHAVGRRKPPAWLLVACALVYAGCGIFAVIACWLTGNGEIWPGTQLSPGLRSWYAAEVHRDRAMAFPPEYLLLAVVAHVLVLFRVRTRAALLAPLPATIAFFGLFLALDHRASEPPIAYLRAEGPAVEAYVTIESNGKGSRLMISAGAPDDVFVPVLHTHRTDDPAPRDLRVDWTRDGTAVLVRAPHERKAAFAVLRDGGTIGRLPVAAHEWPKPEGAYAAPEVLRRFTHARLEVDEYVNAHGGVYFP
jgi:hypothetical protein